MRVILFNLLAILSIPATSQSILSSGTFEIPGTYEFSFDKGIIVTRDVTWHRVSSSDRYLVSLLGRIVNLGLVNFRDLSSEELRTISYGSQRIDGSDRSNTLIVGDVFAVRTRNGNYAKAIVTDIFAPDQNNPLVLQWVTYARSPTAEPKTVSSGTIEIPAAAGFSFDTGTISDVFWRQDDPSTRYLVPAGVAKIVNLGSANFADLTLVELQKLTYGNARTDHINGSDEKYPRYRRRICRPYQRRKLRESYGHGRIGLETESRPDHSVGDLYVPTVALK